MKKNFKKLLFLLLLIAPVAGFSQLTNGGINAYFGVDGDTRSNYVKYGPVTGFIPSDDWFAGYTGGTNIIDTTGGQQLGLTIWLGNNISFTKRMSVPLYSTINGKLWLDAAYGRDYICQGYPFDTTVFVTAAKNGDAPGNWKGGISNVPTKCDILDAYAHMRRDGATVHDSLWLFSAMSTIGTSGSRYYDTELYKDSLTYNNGVFTSKGPDAGHTQWKFDALGNITQTGDLIFAVNFTPGAPPVVDVRIWVSAATFSGIVPKYFNFGPVLDGSTPAFGYVSILSKAGTTNFGSGIANYSAVAANDTTLAAPGWGATLPTGGLWWTYTSQQLVEIGLNLTRIGIDPALYPGLSPCTPMFSQIFFKSRSSNSFTSSLQDFMAPMNFVRLPVMDFSVKTDTLTCVKSSGGITISNNSTIGVYTWSTPNGSITSTTSSGTGSAITFNKPGTYIVSGTPANGCPPTRVDTIVVPMDTFPPIPSTFVGIASNRAFIQLFGGDSIASNYLTPFGRSSGLTYSWTGPNGFSSNTQKPTADTVWGNYQLTVTEKRNGCTATAIQPVISSMFTVMSAPNIVLTGKYTGKVNAIKWSDENSNNVDHYTIEKGTDGMTFTTVGTMSPAMGINNQFSFTDAQPGYKATWYRIKGIQQNGTSAYSNTLRIAGGADSRFYLIRNSQSHNLSLTADVDADYNCNLLICNILGQVLVSKPVHLQRGLNTVDLTNSGFQKNAVGVIVLLKDNAIMYSEKTIF
jgi:hypothetical protein